jgi:hypothetical protein
MSGHESAGTPTPLGAVVGVGPEGGGPGPEYPA